MTSFALKPNFINRILTLLVFLFSITTFLPGIFGGSSRIISVGLLFVFFIVMLFCYFSESFTQKKLVFWILIFSLFIIFYKLIGYSTASWGNYYMQISCLMSIFLIVLMNDYCTRKQRLFILLSSVIFIIYLIYQDIQLGVRVSDIYNQEELLHVNAASTVFNSTVLILGCIFLFLCFRQNIKMYKVIYISLFIFISYYLIFFGERGSIVLTLFLMLFLFIYISAGRSVLKLILIFFGGICCFLYLLDSNSIFSFLLSISPSDRLSDRIIDLMQTTEKGLSENSFSGRFGLYIVSIESFLSSAKSILIGIGDHRLEGIEGYYRSGIGGHSEIIDSFARYGLVGVIILVLLMRKYYDYLISLFVDLKDVKIIKLLFYIFIFLSLTKTVLYTSVGLVFFLLLPLSKELLIKKK